MLQRTELLCYSDKRNLLLPYALVFCLLATSLAFAAGSDEEGLRQRRERMPKKNTAQQIAVVPYTIIKIPFLLTGRALRHTFTFIEGTTVLPQVRDFLTSTDGLVSLSPTVSFGGRAGLMGELTYSNKRFVKRGNRLRLHTAYSVEGHQNHYVRYQVYDLVGPVYLDMRGGYNVNTNEDFFGIGPDLSDIEGDGDLDDETNFRHEQLGGDLAIGAKWGKYAHTEFLVDFTDHMIKDGEGTSLSTLEKFTSEAIPGLEGAALIGVGGRVALDTRDNDFYPSRGFLAAVSATVFSQTDESELNTYGFTRYNVELAH